MQLNMLLVNKSSPLKILPEDIAWVSKLMNKDFSDPELCNVIENLESCDIHACPGSGKTTTMVAKLVILASKLNGQLTGICALSHTNAARLEIELIAGKYSNSLLRYPHFIGTFQVFVHTFLAIPGYIDEFGYPPTFIDNKSFSDEARKNYYRLPQNTRRYLEHRPRGDSGEWLYKLAYKSDDRELLIDCDTLKPPSSLGISGQTFENVLKWKKYLTSMGYLTFQDAYTFAFSYLKKYPSIIPLISKRFPLVFIDEMQDTIKPQKDLIELIFKDRSTLQQFGDPNQAIFDTRDESGEPLWQPKATYAITKSRRLSPSIAKLSQCLSVSQINIIGNSDRPDCEHTIILFSLSNVEKVISRFGELIESQHLNRGIFKAIGAVANPKEDEKKLTITSYYPAYEARSITPNNNNSFWRLMVSAHAAILDYNRYTEAYPQILDALAELFRIQGSRINDKRPDRSSCLTFIRNTGPANFLEFKKVILLLCELLTNHGDLEKLSILSIMKNIFLCFGIELSAQVESHILGASVDPVLLAEKKSFPNNLVYNQDIHIEVNTIHSVKGQTHQATLLLETFFCYHDLSTIKLYLSGKAEKRPGKNIKTRYLPLSYVACTRPTHLLCLAIEETHLNSSDIEQLSAHGWHIDRTLIVPVS